jgi:multidrug resistance efflux pump
MTNQQDSAPITPTPKTAELRERVRSLRIPDEVPRRRSGAAKWWSLLVLLLLGTNLATLWWTSANKGVAVDGAALGQTTGASPTPAPTNATALAGADKSAAAPTGEADRAKSGDIVLEAKGYIVAAHQILVTPRVNGLVTKLNVVEGARVQKGDILALVEDTEYRADRDRAGGLLHAAEAVLEELENGARPQELEQARAELAEIREQLAEANRTLTRETQLVAKQAGTEQALTQARAQVAQLRQRESRLAASVNLLEEGPRKERIDAQRAQVEQARAEFVRAQWRFDNCTIRAPISGTILKKNAEENNLVNSMAFNGNFSLCDMADLSDLEVDLTILERDISRVFAGQKCEVRAEAFSDRRYEGYVDRLLPIADRAKGAVPVRVKVRVPAEEEGVYLKPEMGAIVTFYDAIDEASGRAAPRASDDAQASL